MFLSCVFLFVFALFLRKDIVLTVPNGVFFCCFFFFSSRRRHTRFKCDWSSDVCSSDLAVFQLSPSSTGWTVNVIFGFGGSTGYSPLGNLVFDKASNLYGTTELVSPSGV